MVIFRQKKDNGHTEVLNYSSDSEEDGCEVARLETGRLVKGCDSMNK